MQQYNALSIEPWMNPVRYPKGWLKEFLDRPFTVARSVNGRTYDQDEVRPMPAGVSRMG